VKSLSVRFGVRLAALYALAATITLACLFVVGYELLENYLVHGLDLLNAAEFQQIRARLGPDYATLDSKVIDARIRETTEYASVLFYIDIDSHRQDGILFYSNNLQKRPIPDVEGQPFYNARMRGIGALRVAEFPLPPFDVTIATPLRQVHKVMEGYIEVCSALLGAMLLVSVGIGFALSQVALRPVRLIRETAKRIGSDNLSERIPVGRVRDELSELAGLLNEMFDRLEYSFNQIRRFTAEASHELKTPLSLARLQAEKLIVGGELAPAHEEALQMQLEELARLSRIIEELLFLSRAEARAISLTLTPQEPREFLQALAVDARVLVEYHGRQFVVECIGAGKVPLDANRMRQVVLNLLSNAIDASPRGTTIALRSVLDGGLWRLSVEDEGPGVPADQRERIFERFVRLKGDEVEGSGSGLGLAICKSIVELHHGRIHAESAGGERGLRVIIEIPAEGNNEQSLRRDVRSARAPLT
jgi:two-component system heavy metal sensor histidine kinase CusS